MDITNLFPGWMVPGDIDVIKTVEKFYTVALVIGYLIAMASMGVGFVLMLKGYMEQNPQEVNEARTAIFSSFLAMGLLAMFSLIVGIIFRIGGITL
jgi:predicted acetyltransferase